MPISLRHSGHRLIGLARHLTNQFNQRPSSARPPGDSAPDERETIKTAVKSRVDSIDATHGITDAAVIIVIRATHLPSIVRRMADAIF